MLTKEMFAEKMAETLRSIEEVTTVEIKPIQKNNGVELIGVIPQNTSNVFPTFYVDDYYERYKKGTDIDILMDELVVSYSKHKVGKKIDVSLFTDFEKVKDKIVPRLINSKSNENFLKDTPHRMMGDLAVVYYITLSKTFDGMASVAIRNEILKKLGVTEEVLFELSLDNVKQLKPQFISLDFMLASTLIPDFEDKSEEEQNRLMEEMNLHSSDIGMYVITNKDKSYGASSVLDKDTMDHIYEKLGEFYILPSSVHELIVVPKNSESPTVGELRELVRDTNANQVAEQDVLSDSVYLYDGKFKVA